MNLRFCWVWSGPCSPNPALAILVHYFWAAMAPPRFPTAASSVSLVPWDPRAGPLLGRFSGYWLPCPSLSLLPEVGSTLHSQAPSFQGWVYRDLSQYKIPFAVLLKQTLDLSFAIFVTCFPSPIIFYPRHTIFSEKNISWGFGRYTKSLCGGFPFNFKYVLTTPYG